MSNEVDYAGLFEANKRLKAEVTRLQAELESDADFNHAANCTGKGISRMCLGCIEGDRNELEAEVERLQVRNEEMQSLYVAVGECNREDVPAAVYAAWKAPAGYYRCELKRLQTLAGETM